MLEQKFYSIKEVATRFGVSAKLVEVWLYKSDPLMPSLKVVSVVRFFGTNGGLN
ncbi:MAG: hypothetical protein AAF530_25445 [Pseudomonadota bacterium]